MGVPKLLRPQEFREEKRMVYKTICTYKSTLQHNKVMHYFFIMNNDPIKEFYIDEQISQLRNKGIGFRNRFSLGNKLNCHVAMWPCGRFPNLSYVMSHPNREHTIRFR